MNVKIDSGVRSNNVGWRIPEWCSAISISRASFYLLRHPPGCVKIGARTVVIESPAEYLNRLAEQQKGAA
jgi:hypothetical protein